MRPNRKIYIVASGIFPAGILTGPGRHPRRAPGFSPPIEEPYADSVPAFEAPERPNGVCSKSTLPNGPAGNKPVAGGLALHIELPIGDIVITIVTAFLNRRPRESPPFTSITDSSRSEASGPWRNPRYHAGLPATSTRWRSRKRPLSNCSFLPMSKCRRSSKWRAYSSPAEPTDLEKWPPSF
jgi:hypothetical protein